MIKLLSPLKSIGLEQIPQGLKIAELRQSRGSLIIEDLVTLPLGPTLNVKRLDKHQPFLTTGIEGYEVLLRQMYLPLQKEKDIQEALVFQAEPLLPYPVDQALLAKQNLNQSSEGTHLILMSLKKENLQSHLEQWQQLHIEPEKVACVQIALRQFAKQYITAEKAVILVYLQEQSLTCVLVNQGHLLASFSQQEGLNLLSTALEKDLKQTDQEIIEKTLKELNFSALNETHYPQLSQALKRLQRNVAKMCFALTKELKTAAVEGIFITGEGVRLSGFSSFLLQNLSSNLPLNEEPRAVSASFSFEDLLCYAVPIGLAINSFPSQKESVDFRQQEFSYPKPLKRLLKPLVGYFACMLGLSVAFYFFGQKVLENEENQIKQNYIDLLAGLGKSYDEFETTYQAKNPAAKERYQGEIVSVVHLSDAELQDRLDFLQSDIQSTPDSFPLFANTPRVSDVLAWLSQHPAVLAVDESGAQEARLLLENFSYNLIKRPEQGKKQERYQVKVDLEFSTSVPKLAREFHDALIAPNDFVDPKAEIKWNADHGKYKTSFFLKDKTSYL